MGIDTVRMIVSVAAVRTRAFDQGDSAAQVNDFLLLFDFAQQRGFEVNKSHIENKLRFVCCPQDFAAVVSKRIKFCYSAGYSLCRPSAARLPTDMSQFYA